jgi:P4 family phage/plasmid primase-like protien
MLFNQLNLPSLCSPLDSEETMMHAKNSRLGAARRYASYGWWVLAVHSVRPDGCTCANPFCDRPGKHPLTSHGVKDATTDPAIFEKWWANWPDANVAIAAGPDSNILVIDVDLRNGGVETLKALERKYGSLRGTTTAITGGGGRHFIFAHPGFPVRKSGLGKGIDVLSVGQYIVAAPSNHPSGRVYSWLKGHDPDQKPPQRLPSVYNNLLRVPEVTRVAGATAPGPIGAVTAGHRNTRLTSFGGKLRRSGFSEAAIRAALVAENATLQPPLDQAEVERIVASLLRYAAASGDGIDDPSFEFVERVLAADFAGGDHLMFVSSTFWRYSGRHWYRTPDEAIQHCVLNAIRTGGVPKGYRPNALSREVVSLLKARTIREDDPLRFQAAPLSVINLRNGELWFDAKGNVSLEPHSPASGLRHCLEVDYDPAATCPQFDRALSEIFANSGDPAGMANLWDMLCGYIIQPDRRFALIIILWGTGSNGKSSLTDTLARLLGYDLVYAGQVEKLAESRFAFGSLFGKLVFIDDDVPAGIKLPDGELKTISEAKLLTGEEKYKPTFNFISRTVPILLCNSVPSLADLSYGMRRRLLIIPFQRRFRKDLINRELFPFIWDNEMSGVLNRALNGYRRLLQAGNLQWPAPVINETRRWLREANPINAFIAEGCARDPKGRTLLAALYNAFCIWTKAAGITRTQQRITFRRNLEFLGYTIIHTNQGDTVLGLVLRTHTQSTMGRAV